MATSPSPARQLDCQQAFAVGGLCFGVDYQQEALPARQQDYSWPLPHVSTSRTLPPPRLYPTMATSWLLLLLLLWPLHSSQVTPYHTMIPYIINTVLSYAVTIPVTCTY